MTPDTFSTERHRIEEMLSLLERSSDQLLAGQPIALSELSEGALKADGSPVLASCLEEHVAARVPLAGMERALTALAAGDRSAAVAFAESARDYIKLWREHVRADDRLFSARDQ